MPTFNFSTIAPRKSRNAAPAPTPDQQRAAALKALAVHVQAEMAVRRVHILTDSVICAEWLGLFNQLEALWALENFLADFADLSPSRQRAILDAVADTAVEHAEALRAEQPRLCRILDAAAFRGHHGDCEVYAVPSESAPGKTWSVLVDAFTGRCDCECRGAAHSGRCWHGNAAGSAWARRHAVDEIDMPDDDRLDAMEAEEPAPRRELPVIAPSTATAFSCRYAGLLGLSHGVAIAASGRPNGHLVIVSADGQDGECDCPAGKARASALPHERGAHCEHFVAALNFLVARDTEFCDAMGRVVGPMKPLAPGHTMNLGKMPATIGDPGRMTANYLEVFGE